MSVEPANLARVRPGRVITFYSYKGGVGRSMALANLGVLLAHRGFRVLMVDFDLEAPGLHRYFDQWLPSTMQRIGKGVLPLLKSISEGGSISTEEHVLSIHLERRESLGTDFQPLHLLPSGLGSPGYARDLQDFSWANFIAHHDGAAVIDAWRSEWIAPDHVTGLPKYDLVLVDSRTGLTDHGSVCTILLPDVLALCFAANEQNLQGIKAVARSAQAARAGLPNSRPQLSLLPLLTRFDGNDEFDEGQNWLTKISVELGFCYANWLPNTIEPRRMLVLTKLPYVSKFSFGEPLPVLLQGTDDPASIGYALSVTAGLLGSQFKSVEDLEQQTHGAPLKRLPPWEVMSGRPSPFCPNCRTNLPDEVESWICLRPQIQPRSETASLGGTVFESETGQWGPSYELEGEICGAFNPAGSLCAKCSQERQKGLSVDACPACGDELPDFRKLDSRCITITGPSGSGKTSYMVALSNWWQRNLIHFDITVSPVMSEQRKREFRLLENRLLRQRSSLQPTPSRRIASFSWRLVDRRVDRPDLLITLPDVSGEGLLESRRLIANRYYQDAAGIIFLLDASRMLPEGGGRDPRDHFDVAQAMIADLQRRYRGLDTSPISMNAIPMAVCINKIDLLVAHDHTWTSIIKSFQPMHNGYFDFASCHERSSHIRNLLYVDPDIAAAISLIESHFQNVMFFSTATVGSDGEEDVVFMPVSVEDPFLFLLWHLGWVNAGDISH